MELIESGYAVIDIPSTMGIVEMNSTARIFHTLQHTIGNVMCDKCRKSGKTAVCIDHAAKIKCLYRKRDTPPAE